MLGSSFFASSTVARSSASKTIARAPQCDARYASSLGVERHDTATAAPPMRATPVAASTNSGRFFIMRSTLVPRPNPRRESDAATESRRRSSSAKVIDSSRHLSAGFVGAFMAWMRYACDGFRAPARSAVTSARTPGTEKSHIMPLV